MPDRLDLFEPTVRQEATAGFRRALPPSRWVGVLTPIAGLAAAVIRLEQGKLVVGRDKDCDAVLADESVSRQHACLTRSGDDFVLEDLGSFNGTHVGGVPILSCVLHDGDTVQLGQNLDSFELALRPTPPGRNSDEWPHRAVLGDARVDPVFSMGFIEGDSLAQQVISGPLPPRPAAALVGRSPWQ